MLSSKKRCDEAIPLLRAGLQKLPNNARAHSELSFCYWISQNAIPDKVNLTLQEIEKAIQLEPLNTDYLFNYALLLMNIGRSNDAIPILEKIKEIEPNDFQFIYILATAYCETGNANKALENFNRALSMQPSSAEAYLEYAYCLIRLNNLEMAHQALLKALELNPNLIDAHYYLGLLYEKQGNTSLSNHYYQTFLSNASPDNPLLPDAKNRAEKLKKIME